MSTISVPLSDDMLNGIKNLIERGIASNMSDAIRQAIQRYLEEQAVSAVLKAAGEPSLKGDLNKLAKKL